MILPMVVINFIMRHFCVNPTTHCGSADRACSPSPEFPREVNIWRGHREKTSGALASGGRVMISSLSLRGLLAPANDVLARVPSLSSSVPRSMEAPQLRLSSDPVREKPRERLGDPARDESHEDTGVLARVSFFDLGQGLVGGRGREEGKFPPISLPTISSSESLPPLSLRTET